MGLSQRGKEELTVVRTNGSTQKIHHSAIEPHIALSEIDENGNQCSGLHARQFTR